MIIQGKDITGPVHESADVCIIGSGCGGGAAAKVLAEAGRKVVLVEEGGAYSSVDFDATEETAYTTLYRQRAGQSTDDLSVIVLQGRCIGGSSLVNWTTSLRTPGFVLEAWERDCGVVGLSARDLEPYFERIERYLHVHAEPDENHNANNRILLDGARRLGYHAFASGRNTLGCVKAGLCGLGCPFDAKMSVNLTYIPDAIRAGAMVYSDVRAERMERRGSGVFVSGSVLHRETHEPKAGFFIEAPVVVVAASAIHSPLLLRNSGLARDSVTGSHLTFHLTSAVLGLYDRVIDPAGGIPQSAVCAQFLNRNGDGGGFWIEAVPAYPALAALALPGFGAAHRAMMGRYEHFGALIVLVKEIDSEGSVTSNRYGRPSIAYTPGRRDLAYLKEGLEIAARIHFAAGATRVMTLHSRPTEFTSPAGIAPGLARARWGSNDLTLFSAHPLGTCRMGADPGRSTVDSRGRLHDGSPVFVMDGSVTPTSLGVNPQITILAIAERNAEWLADNYAAVASRASR